MTKEKELERLLKAAANRRRLAILRYLKRAGRASVGEIAEHINLSFKATSKHLGVLASADAVEKEQVGTTVEYRLSEHRHPLTRKLLEIL